MKRKVISRWVGMSALALGLAGCTTLPTGPSHMALPGTGKNFDQFRMDDGECRQHAQQASGATPAAVQENAAVKSAVVGTVIGAAAGAAIGGSSHSAGAGAGMGLLIGALTGAAAGDQSVNAVQRRYDNGYAQCMYAKGHRVAVSGRMETRPALQAQPAPQPYYTPPPPGSPTPPQQPQAQQSPSPQAPYYGAPPPPGSAPPPPSAIVR